MEFPKQSLEAMESELIPPSDGITVFAGIPVRAVPESGRGTGSAGRAPQELGAGTANRGRGGAVARPVCGRAGRCRRYLSGRPEQAGQSFMRRRRRSKRSDRR